MLKSQCTVVRSSNRGSLCREFLTLCFRIRTPPKKMTEKFRKGTENTPPETNMTMENTTMNEDVSYLVVSFFQFSPRKLGTIPILTNIFRLGWNHQLVSVCFFGGFRNFVHNFPQIFEGSLQINEVSYVRKFLRKSHQACENKPHISMAGLAVWTPSIEAIFDFFKI